MELTGTHLMKWELKHSEPLLCFKSRLSDMISEIDESDHFCIWTQFVHCLALCHKFFANSKYDESQAMIEKCQKIITVMESYGGCFADITSGLWYITLKCRADVVQGENENNTLNIPSEPNIAAINGTLAAFLLAFNIRYRDMMAYSDRALQLNPTNELWHFVRVQCLSQFKHKGDYHFANWKENLEYVVSKANRPWPMVYAADEYRIYAPKCRPNSDRRKKYLRSAELYCKAAISGEKSEFIIARVVIGCVYLPKQYRNERSIVKCVHQINSLKTLRAISYFALGVYQESNKCHMMASESFTKSVLLGFEKAAQPLFKLKLQSYESYNPTDDLLQILKNMENLPSKICFCVEILCQLASYEFFVNSDLMKAVKYWCQATDINLLCRALKSHKCWFGKGKYINLSKTIGEEAKKNLDLEYRSGHRRRAKRKLLRKACMTYEQHLLPKQEKLEKQHGATQSLGSMDGTEGKENQNTDVMNPEEEFEEFEDFEEFEEFEQHDFDAIICSLQRSTFHPPVSKKLFQKLSVKCRTKYSKKNRQLWLEYRKNLTKVADQYSLSDMRDSWPVRDWWIVDGRKFRKKYLSCSYFERILSEVALENSCKVSKSRGCKSKKNKLSKSK